MSPEVYNGNPPTKESDIWSVGVTVVAMASGKPLNEGMDRPQLIQSLMAYDVQYEIPEEFARLRAVVKECFRREIERPGAQLLLRSCFGFGRARAIITENA